MRRNRRRTRNVNEKRSGSSNGAKKGSRSNGQHATQTQTTASQGQTELIKCRLRKPIVRETEYVNGRGANLRVKVSTS